MIVKVARDNIVWEGTPRTFREDEEFREQYIPLPNPVITLPTIN
jgi:hypothetical protein